MELRTHLRTAGEALAVKNTRMTTDELLASCGESTPYAPCEYPVCHIALSPSAKRWYGAWCVLDPLRLKTSIG